MDTANEWDIVCYVPCVTRLERGVVVKHEALQLAAEEFQCRKPADISHIDKELEGWVLAGQRMYARPPLTHALTDSMRY